MNKTLVLTPAMMLGIVLTVLPSLGGTVWWVSNLATRLEVTENSVAALNDMDTSLLQERLAALETSINFNNDTNDRLSALIEKNKNSLASDINSVEEKLSEWMESELEKIYRIVNENPLGN